MALWTHPCHRCVPDRAGGGRLAAGPRRLNGARRRHGAEARRRNAHRPQGLHGDIGCAEHFRHVGRCLERDSVRRRGSGRRRIAARRHQRVDPDRRQTVDTVLRYRRRRQSAVDPGQGHRTHRDSYHSASPVQSRRRRRGDQYRHAQEAPRGRIRLGPDQPRQRRTLGLGRGRQLHVRAARRVRHRGISTGLPPSVHPIGPDRAGFDHRAADRQQELHR